MAENFRGRYFISKSANKAVNDLISDAQTQKLIGPILKELALAVVKKHPEGDVSLLAGMFEIINTSQMKSGGDSLLDKYNKSNESVKKSDVDGNVESIVDDSASYQSSATEINTATQEELINDVILEVDDSAAAFSMHGFFNTTD